MEINENLCEGLVPVRDLADDYYDFDEKNYCLVGRRRGVRYRLGDNVKVKVARANLERKQLDFLLVDDRGHGPGEDDLGYKVSARQAVRQGKKNNPKQKTRSRARSRRQ